MTSQAYDHHLNLLLGDVIETVTTTEYDEETLEEIVKVKGHVCPLTRQTSTRRIDALYVRGDGIILISPPLRTG